MSATETPPVLFACFVDEVKGEMRSLDWEEVRAWKPGDGFLWVHMNRGAEETALWVESQPDIDRLTARALLADETRPRCLPTSSTLLLILRGVNLNPGADPEDMVSLRAWASANKVITIRGQKVLAVQDVREHMDAGVSLSGPGDLLARLASRLIDRVGPVVDELQDRLDGLEEELLDSADKKIRQELASIRREAVGLRRYLSPQRDVLARMSVETLPWLTEIDRARFRETTDRVTRYVEDLDATRERAAVTQEELTTRLQDRLNSNTYVLTLVAAVFLPISFATGLLGINVGGIPGAESEGAFLMVCLLLAGIAGLEIALFYFRRWM